jgi:hypothetical protein
MGARSQDRDTADLAVRIVIAELRAFRRVITEASLSDSVAISRWSRATLPNVLYQIGQSDRIADLVRQARADAEAFEQGLTHPCESGRPGDVDILRREAAGSVEHLIAVLGATTGMPHATI